MNYYSHHIGDYRRDTSHLSLLEHGVYRQLIDMYCLSEERIPEETDWVIRRLSARTEEEKKAVISVLNEFFYLENGWVHKRCEVEIAAYKNKARRAQDNGKLGGRPSKTQPVISGLSDETQTKANHKPITINQEPITNINTLVIPSEVTSVPVQEIVELFNKSFPELPQVQKLSESRRKLVRQRWVQNPELQAVEKWTKFFTFVRASDFLMGRTQNPWHGMCFDWMFNASNFTKIYEGNYHGGDK